MEFNLIESHMMMMDEVGEMNGWDGVGTASVLLVLLLLLLSYLSPRRPVGSVVEIQFFLS